MTEMEHGIHYNIILNVNIVHILHVYQLQITACVSYVRKPNYGAKIFLLSVPKNFQF